MNNVRRLVSAEDEYQTLDHVWNRRAQRFLRDMRMLGADTSVIAELLRDLLGVVEEGFASRSVGHFCRRRCTMTQRTPKNLPVKPYAPTQRDRDVVRAQVERNQENPPPPKTKFVWLEDKIEQTALAWTTLTCFRRSYSSIRQ